MPEIGRVSERRGTVVEMVRMRTVGVRLTEDLADWIERFRAELQAASPVPVSTSDAVRILLERARAAHEKPRPASKPRKR